MSVVSRAREIVRTSGRSGVALICFVFAGAGCTATPQQAERVFDGETAMSDLERQLAFGPRVPNTESHRKTGDWMRQRLTLLADTVHERSFTHVTGAGDTLRLRNFLARFRPAAARRIMYVAHWDTRPLADASPDAADRLRPVPGANDGASGVALLLGVAAALAADPPREGVDLLFVDGEDYGDFENPTRDDVLIGSRYYATTRNREVDPEFVIVWDMVADRDLRFRREGYSLSGAPDVVARVWDVARSRGHDTVFVDAASPPIIDDHLALQQGGLRAIVVIDLEYGPDNSYHHTTRDDLSAVSQSSLEVAGEVALALIP